MNLKYLIKKKNNRHPYKSLEESCSSVQFSLVPQSCLILCDPMDCSIPGFPVHYQLSELAQTYLHQVGDTSNHLILCPSLLLLSIFPSIRVFSSESVLHIRLAKYWSFSFSISPSKEYSGLISSRIDWFDLFGVQESCNIKEIFPEKVENKS